MFGLNKEELRTLRSLSTPAKIQDFLETLEINFEERGETCMSPRRVLRAGKAHCMEGAMLAALALRIQGERPLVVDLEAAMDDEDHVIAVFRKYRRWGAITKSNHAVLRYREPVYRSIRELSLSFFHEYFKDDGRKTLRSYSAPVNLARFDRRGWITSEKNIWYIPRYLAKIPHTKIISRSQIRGLRRADPIECKAGKLVDWHKPLKEIAPAVD